MAKVVMTCGKICCGKSTYARTLRDELGAVILSIDEITLSLFPEGAGDLHDIYALRAEKYLLSLTLQILSAGTDVILDWGLWTKAQRSRLRAFWNENHIANEIHYLKLSPSEWERRISKRNAEINKQEPSAYEVDEGLLKKTESLFEEPSKEEVDRIVVQ